MISLSVTLGAQLLLAAVPTNQAEEAKQPLAAQQQQQESDLHPVEQKIVEQTNAERRRFGLRPLKLDLGLLRSARRHTQWMTRNHALQHTNQPVAENIACGQRSANEAVGAWMNSSGHRANLLNASYTHIGVAAYQSNSGTIYWCQQFRR